MSAVSALTIVPSHISMMRWACAATSAAWVTITMVIPAEPRRSSSSRKRGGRRGVETSGGLIGQQDLGLVGQRPSDRDALALATRELRREAVLAATEADLFQQLAGSDLPLPGGQVGTEHGEFHIGKARQLRKEVMELKDQADLLPPVATQVMEVGQVVPGYDYRA